MENPKNTTPSELRIAYQKSWNQLTQYLQSNANREDYEKKVAKCVEPVLEAIGNSINHEVFNIGRGLIHLNSRFMNRRLSLPFVGPAYPLASWQREYFQHDTSLPGAQDKQLMFLQPDRPLHLLTELMWRFQGKNQWGKGHALAIFPSNDSELLKIVKKTTIIPLILTDSHDDDLHVYLNDLHNNGWKKEKIRLCEELNRIRNNWKKYASVPLGRKYDIDDIERLMRRPLDILSGNRKPYKLEPPPNIFYLPDVVETEHIGAIDFEIKINTPIDVEKTVSIEKFLQEVQWQISKYVIELITSAEHNYAADGDIYRDVYFAKESHGAQKDYIGISGFSNLLNLDQSYYDSRFREYPTIEALFSKLQTHFNLANSEIGLYWRGYRKHAYEVACTVAGIVDILFKDTLLKEEGSGFEKVLRSCGPRMEDIESHLKNINTKAGRKIPYIFKQLFKGLATEEQLFLIPLYREHFIHSFYCFTVGTILMMAGLENVVPSKLRLKGKSEKVCLEHIKRWFIVSMWHDVSYVLQKGHEILERYVMRFLDERRRSRYRGIIPWIPSLGHLMQVDGVLEKIRNSSKEALWLSPQYCKKKGDSREVMCNEVVLAAAFDRIDHGVWSAMLLSHGWAEDDFYSVWGKSENLTDKDLKSIVEAIMVHHVADWKIHSLLKDFEAFDREKAEKKKPPDHELINIRRGKNPLGYLLAFCDLICQAGREAPEMADRHASNIGIRFGKIYINKYRSLKVSLHYSKNIHKTVKEIKEEFYLAPTKFLCLKDSDGQSHHESLYVTLYDSKKKSSTIGFGFDL